MHRYLGTDTNKRRRSHGQNVSFICLALKKYMRERKRSRSNSVMKRSKWIDIEVEVGEGLAFEIVEEVDGFWIGYTPEEFEGWKPSKSDLRWVVRWIKKVMKDLGIKVPHLALHLVLFGALGGFGNPTCCVDKRKEVLYLRLPIDVVDGHLAVPSENHEDYILYHELMHAKDVLEERFPSGGFFNSNENPKLALITSLWHFSIEGRLEKSGKPYKSRQKVIEDEYFWASDLKKAEMVEVKPKHWQRRVHPWPLKKIITKEFFQELCDKLWGKEVTFQELQSLLKAPPKHSRT